MRADHLCPTCGLPTKELDERTGRGYFDTQGGHNDRHTLVTEAAERVIEGGAIPCPKCGALSWNAAVNPGEPCLPCKRKEVAS